LKNLSLIDYICVTTNQCLTKKGATMKKILLLILALCAGLGGFSQIATVPKQLINKSAKTIYKPPVRDEINFNQPVNLTVKAEMVSPFETVIGKTFYDIQSNTCLNDRLYLHADGTIGGVWTMGMESTTFPDRGSGYNYYDGSAWGPEPTARIESVRAGWPSYSAWGPTGEIVCAHLANDMNIATREVKGTGDWTQSQILAGTEVKPTWPRVATTGDNHEIIQLLFSSYNAYAGQTSALLYSRSSDGGQTWDPFEQILDGTGSEYYLGIRSESYTLAARGNTIAIFVADAWTDAFIMKSTDNGDNWEKIMVWEHPYPMFDFNVTLTDTFFCIDNSGSVAIGPDGIVHVVFGLTRVLHDVLGTTFSLFYFVDGIGYWNEGMPAFSNARDALAGPQYGFPGSEMVENVNYIGWSQDVNGNGVLDLINPPYSYRELGISTMPNIAVDNNGRIFVVWASSTETYDNVDFNYKKIWMRAYDNGEWGPFYNETADIIHIFDESIYPVMAANTDDNIHIIYQADGTPGTALDGDHDYQENRIIHAAVPKTDLLTGIGEHNVEINRECVSQNYPNPFSGKSTITVNLLKAAKLSMEVTNITGQKVLYKDRGYVNAGTYMFEVNASQWPTGTYFYTVKAGNNSVTKKMIVR
jgi:hypothetical protein